MLGVQACGAKMASTYFTEQKENYYTRDMTTRDEWQGALCAEIGIADGAKINPEDFQTVLAARQSKCVAYDLTFSAPKSVSVASQLADAITRADMIEAHRAAVAETLREIEKHETYTRIKHDGEITRIRTGKAAFAKFEHNVSRDCDPQMHTHAVMLNNTLYNGKLYAIDGSPLYNLQKVYGIEYRARLARELRARGYEITVTDPEKGFFELAGMDREDLEIFSKRRREIEKDMEERGESGTRAAQKASIRTREAKKAVNQEELRAEWRAEWGDRKIATKAETLAAHDIRAEQRAAYAEAVAELEAKSYAWTQKEFEKEILARGVACEMTRQRARELIAADPAIRRGRLKEKGKEPKEYFSTERNIQTEAELFRSVAEGRGAFGKALDHKTVEKYLADIQKEHGWTLTEQQRGLCEHIAETPDQIIAVRGLAGTGKSFTLNAARELLEKEGFEIMGAAPSGKAAAELAADAGLEGMTPEGATRCGTMQRILNEAERNAGNARPGEDYEKKKEWNFDGAAAPERPRVYFVDEAGMADNYTLKGVFEMAAAQRAAGQEIKVVLVGDDRQLPPVGVGNFFSDVLQQPDAISVAELSDIRRQRDPELLQAVRESVKGSPDQALEILAEKESIKEIKTPKGRISAIKKEYIDLSPEEREKTAILTARNADRIKINEEIRAELVKRGELEQGKEYEVEAIKGKAAVSRSFAEGDKIIFLKNDLKIGVRNGMQGKIEKIEGNDFTIQTDGEKVQIDITEYNRIDHAYCITSHKAQGATVDKVIINMNSNDKTLNTRNKFYVDISRARDQVSLYCDNKEACGEQVQQFAEKYTSKDFDFDEKEGRFVRAGQIKETPSKVVSGLVPQTQHEKDVSKAMEKSLNMAIKEAEQKKAIKAGELEKSNRVGKEHGIELSM